MKLEHFLTPYVVLCLVTQSCWTPFDPVGCSLPSSSVHGDSPGKNTGVGCHVLLQGIFPTQGSNPSILHYRQILYLLSHQGSPRILEGLAYPFSRASSWPRNRTGVSCIVGRFFTSWATKGVVRVQSICALNCDPLCISSPFTARPTKYTHPLPQFFVQDFSPRLLEASLLPQGGQSFHLRSILVSLGHHGKMPYTTRWLRQEKFIPLHF